MDGGAAGPGNRKGLPDSCVRAWSFTGFIGGCDFAEDDLQLGPVANGRKFFRGNNLCELAEVRNS